MASLLVPHFPQVGGIFLVHNLHKGRRATMATDAIAATIAAFTTVMAAEYSLPVLPRCSRPHHFGRLAAILLIFGPRCTRPDLKASLQPSSFWCLAAVLLILGPRCQPPHFGASLHSSGFTQKRKPGIPYGGRKKYCNCRKVCHHQTVALTGQPSPPVPPEIQCWGVCASTPP